MAYGAAAGLLLALLAVVVNAADGSGAMMLELKHRFEGRTLEQLMRDRFEHDRRRLEQQPPHTLEPEIGATSREGLGIFYAKIMLGNPPKAYYPMIDSSTDLSWLYCAKCEPCPSFSSFGFPIHSYDISKSSTAEKMSCEDELCLLFGNESMAEACGADNVCQYKRDYEDMSISQGFILNDTFAFNAATHTGKMTPVSARLTFGCGVHQSGNLVLPEQAFDGELGFGRSNTTLMAQLASQKLTKHSFAHCFAPNEKGGIFAVGGVGLQEKLTTTRLLPHGMGYEVELKALDIGGHPIDVGNASWTAKIELGAFHIYLPEIMRTQLIKQIRATHPSLRTQILVRYICFHITESVDDMFPDLTFHFAGSANLTLRPHQYIYSISEVGNTKCLALQSSSYIPSHSEVIIIGEVALTDKLFVYDLEKMEIGWSNYNCTASLAVNDGDVRTSKTLFSHNIRVSMISAGPHVGAMPSAALLLLFWSSSLAVVLSYFAF